MAFSIKMGAPSHNLIRWFFASVVALILGTGEASGETEFLGQSFSHAVYDYAPSFMFGDGTGVMLWWDRDLNVILLQSCGDPLVGADSLLAGWMEIGFFNGTNTGQPMNHNPGLLRWPSGDARHDEAGWFFVQFGYGGIDPAIWEIW